MTHMLDRETTDKAGRRPTPKLTPREAEVLELTAEGMTNPEVASRLNITVHAVKFHLGSVFRKLEVGNRTEAAIAYVRSLEQNGSPGKGE